MKDFVEVFRHQQPFLADMVIETLKKHDIMINPEILHRSKVADTITFCNKML